MKDTKNKIITRRSNSIATLLVGLPFAGLLVVACAVDGPIDSSAVEEEVGEVSDALGTPSHLCCDAKSCKVASATTTCNGTRFRCTDDLCSVGSYRVTHADAASHARNALKGERDPEADVWDDPFGDFADPCLLWNEVYDDPCPVSSGSGGGSGSGSVGSGAGSGPSDPGGDWQCTKCNLVSNLCVIGCIVSQGPASPPCIAGCINRLIDCAHEHCE